MQLLQQLMVLFPDNPRVQEMVDKPAEQCRSRCAPGEVITGRQRKALPLTAVGSVPELSG
ncbi:hypothetical protein ACLB1M_01685 [Escherichia coli]